MQKALSHGLVFNANYTWSHCIGDIYDQQPPHGGGVTPPYNRRAYRGNCTGIDQRQQFVLSLVATSPRLRNPWARRLLSDWQIAPILQIHSWQWLTVTSGTDRALTTVANQTVNQVLSNPYAANKGVANGNATINWLNLEAFAIPLWEPTARPRMASWLVRD